MNRASATSFNGNNISLREVLRELFPLLHLIVRFAGSQPSLIMRADLSLLKKFTLENLCQYSFVEWLHNSKRSYFIMH